QSADSRSMCSGLSCARPASSFIASLAREIVGADRMAQIRPSARFPIIDHPRLAHISFEALGLAHRRIVGSLKLALHCSTDSNVDQTLIVIESPVGGPDEEIDKSESSSAEGGLLR